MGGIFIRKIVLYSMIFSFFIVFLVSTSGAATNDDINLNDKRFQSVQIPFVENQGQVPDQKVKYTANTLIGNVYVKDDGIDYYFKRGNNRVLVSEKFQNSAKVEVQGINPSKAKVNYFKGKKWYNNIPTYQQLIYKNIYPGIDLNLIAHGNNIEKVYTINQNGNAEDININVYGTTKLSVNKIGDLCIKTKLGMFKLTRPIAFQTINGKKINIGVKYQVENTNYSYQVDNYDHNYPLIIDPLLASTFLGADSYDHGNGVAIDKDGYVFVTGITDSYDFPTTFGAYNRVFSGGDGDVFISKFDRSLTNLMASTFLGGTNKDDCKAIAIDRSNTICITGNTYSKDFPVTADAAFDKYNGAGDAFVSRLNSNLNTLMSSTYIGGDGNERSNAIVVDASNNIYITGATNSPKGLIPYPTTSGAYQCCLKGGYDAFISKFNNNLSYLIASTYLGSSYSGTKSDGDEGRAIILDQSSNVFVTGTTYDLISSPDFPITENAFDEVPNGGTDNFITKFDNILTTVQYSTYLGGAAHDEVHAIAIDDVANIYVTGVTYSTNFPTTIGVKYPNHLGNGDVFLTKLDKYLFKVLQSTYLGGTQQDWAYGLVRDNKGNLYITGYTDSSDFPVENAYQSSLQGREDAFFTIFNSSMNQLITSTYLGGENEDKGMGIAISSSQLPYPNYNRIHDTSGNIFITGHSWTALQKNFPTTPLAFDTTQNGNADVFVTKFGFSDLTMSPLTTPSSGMIGYKILLNNTVRNVGEGNDSGFFVDYYLTDSLQGGEQYYLGERYIASLNGGSINQQITSLIIPEVEIGNYYIMAIVDSTGEQVEINLENNTIYSINQINIKEHKDLVLSTIVAPLTGYRGKIISVTNSIKNLGNRNIGPFYVNYYLVPTKNLNTKFNLGSRLISSIVAYGTNTSKTLLKINPVLVPKGNYFIAVVVDTTNMVTETNEGNNTGYSNTQIAIKDAADLIMVGLSHPAMGIRGRTVSVSNTIKNQGNINAGPFRVLFYLVPYKNLSGAKYYLGSRDLLGLKGNYVNQTSTPLRIGNVPNGYYFIATIIDKEKRIYESDRINNISYSKTRIKIS